MKREVRKYLYDITSSIDSIFEYLGEKRDFFEYQNNKLLRRGIEREIEIIGEAMNRILKLDPAINIHHARKIVDTRKVDDVIIWGIVSNHLPKLRKEIESLLNNDNI